MTADLVFVFDHSLRYGALRALGTNESVVGTVATVMVERLMKRRKYQEAAHVALRGRRWRGASQALRYAVARGSMPFTELFNDQLDGMSYRDALSDSFLGVVMALNVHGRLIESARDELLARGLSASSEIGAHDEAELIASESTDAEAAFERNLWKSAIELVALRALGDWRGLLEATRSAAATIAETPKPVFARVGALRSFLASQIELALALLGEPEYCATERHRRLASGLCDADTSLVLGSVALAAAIRGEIVEAKSVLRLIDARDGDDDRHRMPATEHLTATALIALEDRDEEKLRRALGELSRANLGDSGLGDVRTLIEARSVYMREHGSQSLDALRGAAKQGSLPWAHVEAVALRIEWYLAEGFLAQAQAAIDDVQRTPYARWHVMRLALARSRFAQDQAEAGLKIAESVWVSETATPRHRARALAVGAACAERLGDIAVSEQLQDDMRFFCLRGGMQEPYDDLGSKAREDIGIIGARLRPGLPTPLERIDLTKREREVLRALNDLNGPDEIAVLLHVSKNTVKTQLRHIYRKLGVHSRENALKAAADEGLM